MNIVIRSVFVSCSILVIAVSSYGDGIKYGRALVLQGGGFQTAFMLGMLDAAEKMGHAPDLIIGTCGGSVAVAVANALPESRDQKRFVESPEFYQYLRSIDFIGSNDNLLGALLIAFKMRETALRNIIPDIFQDYLMKVPADFNIPFLHRALGASGRHFIIIGGQALFGPNAVGKKIKGKLFKEVYFTDSETWTKLGSFRSPVALEFPSSDLTPETEITTAIDGSLAARIGISDMFYMHPVKFNGNYYLSGAIDLYPLELAKFLAGEVIFGFSDGFDTIVENPAIASIYHYDQNERLRHVNDMSSDYWVDLSDESEIFKTVGFNPKPDLSTFSVEKRIPNSYQEYVQRVRALWTMGFNRTVEALKLPRNDKSHIRFLRSDNSSASLRASLKKR